MDDVVQDYEEELSRQQVPKKLQKRGGRSESEKRKQAFADKKHKIQSAAQIPSLKLSHINSSNEKEKRSSSR